MFGRSTIGVVEFCNNQTLPGFTIAICVEPHDCVASDADIFHPVVRQLVARVTLNLLLHRNCSGVVIQKENGNARGQIS